MFLDVINLFPESKFLRCKKRPELDHPYGIIASIIIIGFLIIVLTFKLIECINRNTIHVSKRTQTTDFPEAANFTTNVNSPNGNHFMFGYTLFNNECPQTFNVRATYSTQTSQEALSFYSFDFQPCTPQHFGLKNDSVKVYQFDKYMCFPLNLTLQLQGNKQGLTQDNVYKSLQLRFRCRCGSSCGVIETLITNSGVNQQQPEPFIYSFEQNFLDNTVFQVSDYLLTLDQNRITTDRNVMPWSVEKQRQSSLSIRNLKKHRQSRFNSPSSVRITTIRFQRSTFTNYYDRTYLKLADVVSYVGGFIPALISIFFFLKYFSYYFFESTFAFLHFKCKQTKNNGLRLYLKRQLYNVLGKLGFQPEKWKIGKRQYQINELVNRILDINYLYRRVELLQTGMSSLLTPHQLKGVYLSQITIDSAKKQFRQHILRDRVIKHLLDKAEKDREARILLNQRQRERQKMNIPEIVLMPQDPHKGISESNRQLYEQEMIENPKFSKNQKQITVGQSTSKMVEQVPEVGKSKERKNKEKGMIKMAKSNTRKSVVQKEKPEQMVVRVNENDQVQINISRSRDKNIYFLRRHCDMIELANKEDLKQQFEEQIYHEISTYIKQLLQEAKEGTDEVSVRIADNIEEWLKHELEVAIEDIESNKYVIPTKKEQIMEDKLQ